MLVFTNLPQTKHGDGSWYFYYPSFLPGSSYLNCPLAHFTFVALRSFWSGHTSFMFSLGTVFGCILVQRRGPCHIGLKSKA